MFNVRVKRYLDTEQIQIFSEPIYCKNNEDEDRRKVIRETGEIVPHNRRILYNYFEMIKKTTFDGIEIEYPSQEVGYFLHDDDEEESKRRSYRRTKNKVFDMVKCNKWKWFFTLTFNPEKVDSFDYDVTTKKLSKWLQNMRRVCPDMMYIVVPEKHKSGRWHFHGLFANVEEMEFVDSGERDKNGRVIYNVGNYRLGFSTATQISDVSKASSYLVKYITKEMCDVTHGKKRYWNSRNVCLPEVIDIFVENVSGYAEEISKAALYDKKVKGYIDVRYIEKSIYTTN